MSQLREAYKKYSLRLDYILREPTEAELARLAPAFHKLKRRDGKPLTIGNWRDFLEQAWKAKQKRAIVGLLMDAEKNACEWERIGEKEYKCQTHGGEAFGQREVEPDHDCDLKYRS